MLQFSQEGVEEAGFGEAVTKSFFCNVAEAFSKGEVINFVCFLSHHNGLFHFCEPFLNVHTSNGNVVTQLIWACG